MYVLSKYTCRAVITVHVSTCIQCTLILYYVVLHYYVHTYTCVYIHGSLTMIVLVLFYLCTE